MPHPWVALVVLRILILLSPLGADPAYAYDNTSLSGAITCSSTVVVNSQAVASGQISLVADGLGNWTSGSANYQRADGTACDYVLAAGKYTVNDDGSGQSFLRWKLDRSTSARGCAGVVPRSAVAFSIATNSFSASFPGPTSESGTCAFSQ
jgi:hypothetical protein